MGYGRRTLGQDHPALLLWINNLAAVYKRAGRISEAVPLFEEYARFDRKNSAQIIPIR